MSRKFFTQALLIIALLLASFASAGSAYAGGSCGSTVTVQWGDTLSGIAAACGTTVSAFYAANPGLGYYIYAGQVLYVPGGGYGSSGGSGYGNTYIVQSGDTFAKIAGRYSVSVYTLWSYNPQIWNINQIYVGQVIYVPGSSSSSGGTSTSSKNSPDLSYGVAAVGTPNGRVVMTNSANAEVYVSLQGTTRDGISVINEYYVDGTVKATVPTGWYTYVVWAGGNQFSGQFQVKDNHKMNIFMHKVTVQ